jgi:hypothetical protein
MSIMRNVARWGGARAAARLSRAVPVVGGLIAVGMLASAVRRKGLARGALDTALNATPLLGGLKLGLETLRGRDLIRETPSRRSSRIPPALG